DARRGRALRGAARLRRSSRRRSPRQPDAAEAGAEAHRPSGAGATADSGAEDGRPFLGADQLHGVLMEPLIPTRRRFLGASLAGAAWMTGVAEMLSFAAAPPARRSRPSGGTTKSIIMLWLQGGPSQLETFDPYPGQEIAGGTKAIRTAVKDVQLAEGMPLTAEEMGSIALVRSGSSKEGAPEPAPYPLKTGSRPAPTITHASLGAILCHKLPIDGADIPRHVSILPSQWSARGGYLGDQYDAFRTGDP